MNSSKTLLALFAASCVLGVTGSALAQGCVAAHVNQRVISQLVTTDGGRPSSLFSIHNLTLDIGYRVFNSNKYFQGTMRFREPMRCGITRTSSVSASSTASRRGGACSPMCPSSTARAIRSIRRTGIFQVSGLGDMLVGAQAWIFRPPTENGGNVAVSAQLKIPTGINNATGTAMLAGKPIKATADQSMQPGDGGWGFAWARRVTSGCGHRVGLWAGELPFQS